MTETNDLQLETWARIAPELTLHQLDNLERDGVNITCLNSSDFVIGRQTNFNGPVTIITCAEILKQQNHRKRSEEDNEEKVVIKDKVISTSAAKEVQKLATEKPSCQEKPKRDFGMGKFRKMWVVALVCTGLLIAASVCLVFIPTTPTEEPLPQCTSVAKNICILSNFDWGGRQTPSKPLKKPVPYVIISQTQEDYCYDIPVCLKFVKWLQLNTTNETACNFLVGSDGNAYEDVGWSLESSLEGPAAGKAFQICLMGNYSEEEYPTYPQVFTAKTLVELGVENESISKNYTLTSSNATSPGKTLGSVYGIISQWPNFLEDPFGLKHDKSIQQQS